MRSEWLTVNRQNPFQLFSGLFFCKEDFNFNFYICFLQQSFVHKLVVGKHVSSWSPAGIPLQSQDKQVPVLRLFSASELFWYELQIYTEFMESTKYIFFLFFILFIYLF